MILIEPLLKTVTTSIFSQILFKDFIFKKYIPILGYNELRLTVSMFNDISIHSMAAILKILSILIWGKCVKNHQFKGAVVEIIRS